MPPAVVAAGIGAGGSLLGGILGRKSQNDAQDQNAARYNQYLQNYGQGQNKYLDYLKGLGPQTSTSNGMSTTNTNQTSNPFVTQEFSPLVGMTKNILQSRLSGTNGLPQGFAEGGIRDINSTYAGANQAAANQAARYGVSGPQAMALAMGGDRGRAGQIADFRANLPLQARQLQNEDMQMAQNLSSIFGKGEHTQGTSTTRSNNSMTGPAPIAPMVAFLPPGEQMGGAVDPGANLIQGGLQATPAIQNLLLTLMKNKGQQPDAGADPFGFSQVGFEPQDGSGGWQ